MTKRPVSSRPWPPPEGYVDPRRLEKPKADVRGTIGLIVAAVIGLALVLRVIAHTHALASSVATTAPAMPGTGSEQWVQAMFRQSPAIVLTIVAIAGLIYRFRRL